MIFPGQRDATRVKNVEPTMKVYGVSRLTAASPSAVWRVWSDPNNWSRWNSGIAAAEIDGPLANDRHGKMTTTRGTIHAVTFHDVAEGRGFSMSMAGPPLTTITFSCLIEPSGQGSRIEQNVAFAGPLGFLFGALMGNHMAQHFVPVLDDLARTVEQPRA
jgi:uncharacterized protein YndB with AHSA1/START domain